MIWQDYVIGAMTIIFSIALVPQVYHGFKKRKGAILISVGLPTAAGLYVLAVTFATLDLYIAVITNTVTGTLWLMLVLQTVLYGKK